MFRRLILGAVGVALAWGAAGCRSQWAVKTTQPSLMLRADKVTRTSRRLTIVRRDMEMRAPRRISNMYYVAVPRPLYNTAYYVVVSRDRFRFHLTLNHKWESMSDVRTWETWVEDERGVRHIPEHIAQRLVQIGFGRVPVYRGFADFTIYERDLFEAGHRVTLVLRRPGFEYRYEWLSDDDPDGSRDPDELGDPGDPGRPSGLGELGELGELSVPASAVPRWL
jgi:hypothetical protein